MKLWKNFMRSTLVGIAMGQLDDPSLKQRCEGLINRILKLFLNDPRIKKRYRVAFQGGWKSDAWQEIPTLSDILPFCSPGLLGIDDDELSRRALHQIKSQIQGLLDSALGDAVGRPSSYSPSPMMKFFALGGLSGKYESYVLSMSAYASCMRTMLAYPKSLFIGDELSVLFQRPGFSELVGELCAVGRKQGIAMLLLSQDPNGICNSAAGAQISQNLGYRITGSITATAAASFQHFFDYSDSQIRPLSTESYLPNPTEMCSYWLVEKGGRFWNASYYPAPMLLAAVVNSPEETAARSRILSRYPATIPGQLQGLKAFSDKYLQVIQEEEEWSAIAQTDVNTKE